MRHASARPRTNVDDAADRATIIPRMSTTALHHIANRTRKLPPLRVGVGGPVGSGKTTLVEMLCKAMRETYDLVVVTNDIYTKEDQRLLTVAGLGHGEIERFEDVAGDLSDHLGIVDDKTGLHGGEHPWFGRMAQRPTSSARGLERP